MTGVVRLRAGDADREAVVDVLREAHADGRLRLDELEDRLGTAFGATYLDELAPLTADLRAPVPRPLAVPGWRRTGPPPLAFVLAAILGLMVLAGTAWPLLWLLVAVAIFRGGRPGRIHHGWCGAPRQGARG